MNTWTGILVYNDEADYEIHTDKEIINLSAILHDVYVDERSNRLAIKIMEGCKLLFNEDGNLYYNKEPEIGVWTYHVGGEPLEQTLFNNTDKVLEFTVGSDLVGVKDYAKYRKPK